MCLLSILTLMAFAQSPNDLPRVQTPSEQEDRKLPNGKSQRDEIVKADYKRNVQDAEHLSQLAQQLQDDLARSGSNTVSVKTLKTLDDIDKLARGIRGRLKRY